MTKRIGAGKVHEEASITKAKQPKGAIGARGLQDAFNAFLTSLESGDPARIKAHLSRAALGEVALTAEAKGFTTDGALKALAQQYGSEAWLQEDGLPAKVKEKDGKAQVTISVRARDRETIQTIDFERGANGEWLIARM